MMASGAQPYMAQELMEVTVRSVRWTQCSEWRTGGGVGNLRAAEGDEGGCELKGRGERSQDHGTRKRQLRNTPRRRDVNLVPTGEADSPRGESVRSPGDVVRG